MTALWPTPAGLHANPDSGCTSSSGNPAVTDRTFEITFLDPDVQAYSFTFG
jgi:hypothetical protein